jgi:hypothetical protein
MQNNRDRAYSICNDHNNILCKFNRLKVIGAARIGS